MRVRSFLACLCFVLPWQAAQARQDPVPPPSGIVVHLFGPDSVMGNILPAAPAGQAPAGAPRAGAAQAAAAPATPGQPPASSAAGYPEPTLGAVLHQMFVTGDPNDPPRPSTGRIGEGLAN